jgi:hypothetical protein
MKGNTFPVVSTSMPLRQASLAPATLRMPSPAAALDRVVSVLGIHGSSYLSSNSMLYVRASDHSESGCWS